MSKTTICAVAHKKYLYHVGFSFFIALICGVLACFAQFIFFGKIVKNITDLAKCDILRP